MKSDDGSARARSTTPRWDGLDAAIDHAAARMVAVPDNPELLARIVGALPGRPWRRRGLIPQFAALGAIVLAGVLWSLSAPAPAPPVLPSTAIAAVMSPPLVTSREPGTPPLEPLEPVEPLEPLEPLESDFDRALSPIEGMKALAVADTPPRPIEPLSPIGIGSIEVPELKMTAETFSQKEE